MKLVLINVVEERIGESIDQKGIQKEIHWTISNKEKIDCILN
jgi:hypothetical protein